MPWDWHGEFSTNRANFPPAKRTYRAPREPRAERTFRAPGDFFAHREILSRAEAREKFLRADKFSVPLLVSVASPPKVQLNTSFCEPRVFRVPIEFSARRENGSLSDKIFGAPREFSAHRENFLRAEFSVSRPSHNVVKPATRTWTQLL